MKYNLIFSPQSIADLERLKKSEPKTFKKAAIILQELSEHPTTGTGKPENLLVTEPDNGHADYQGSHWGRFSLATFGDSGDTYHLLFLE